MSSGPSILDLGISGPGVPEFSPFYCCLDTNRFVNYEDNADKLIDKYNIDLSLLKDTDQQLDGVLWNIFNADVFHNRWCNSEITDTILYMLQELPINPFPLTDNDILFPSEIPLYMSQYVTKLVRFLNIVLNRNHPLDIVCRNIIINEHRVTHRNEWLSNFPIRELIQFVLISFPHNLEDSNQIFNNYVPCTSSTWFLDRVHEFGTY